MTNEKRTGMRGLIERIKGLECICDYARASPRGGYSSEKCTASIERDIADLEPTECAAVLVAALRSPNQCEGMHPAREAAENYITGLDFQAGDSLRAYETLFQSLPDTTLDGIAKAPWESLNFLLGYKGEALSAPTGESLFRQLVKRVPNHERGDIICAAVNQGIQGAGDCLQQYVDSIDSSQYSDIGKQRIFSHLEKRLAPEAKVPSTGFHVVSGRFFGQKVYCEGKYLGLYCNVTADPSGKTRWITEEVIDQDFTGKQNRITLWSYDPETKGAKIVFEEQNAREGELPTPEQLFAKRAVD